MLEDKMSLDIKIIIVEAYKLGYTFNEAEAQDVIDTKPGWYHGEETEAEAVADYIDAYGG
jgi:regulator of RNase E activity RraB